MGKVGWPEIIFTIWGGFSFLCLLAIVIGGIKEDIQAYRKKKLPVPRNQAVVQSSRKKA